MILNVAINIFTFISISIAQSWILVSDQDNIQTFKMEVTNGPIIAFMGKRMIEAPLDRVLQFITDEKRSHEWVDRLTKEIRLEQPDNLNYVSYTHISMPLILKDREFITAVKIELDKSKQKAFFTMKSINHLLAPKTKYIRGEVVESSFMLESRNEGKSTFVTGILHADPKGSIPKWVVNLFQKQWARNTICKLRLAVLKN